MTLAAPAGFAPRTTPRAEPFSIAVGTGSSCRIIRLRGALASEGARRLGQVLAVDAGGGEVCIDLTACTLLGHEALQVLADAAGRRRLTLVCPHGCIRGMLEFVGIGGRFLRG